MRSLFWRIYFVTLIFFVLVFFLGVYTVNSILPSDAVFDNSTAIEKTIIELIKNQPKNDWSQKVAIFNAVLLKQNVSIVPINTLNYSEKSRLKASTSKRITSDKKISNIYTLYQIPHSNMALKIQEISEPLIPASDIRGLSLFMFVVFSTLAFALFLLVRRISKPIEHLLEIVNRLGKGELNIRAKTNLPKPINTLAKGFNSMADKIHETIEEQQILIGAIPHELRSPLARIRFALDLTRNSASVNELRNEIERIDRYVDEMQQTVNEILTLNKLQNMGGVTTESINICNLVYSLKHHLSHKEQINLRINCNINNDVKADKALLKHALENLLDNAARYATSEITLNAWQDNGCTFIQIDDDGKGIPEEKLKQIFMPFYTRDESRNRANDGIGLGLALVKIIMKKQGGDAIANNNSKGGARITLIW